MFAFGEKKLDDAALDHLIHTWQAIGSPQDLDGLRLTDIPRERLPTAELALGQLLHFIRTDERSTPALRMVRKMLSRQAPTAAPNPDAIPAAA